MQVIELSHTIHDGLVTYPGLPAPSISTYLSFEASRAHYVAGTEFEIARIDMVANTGTYLDTPAHRHRGAEELATLPLEKTANLDGIVVRCRENDGAVGPEALPAVSLEGKAVLFDTGWSQHWGSDMYYTGHPYLSAATVDELVARRVALVGIDSLNIDGTGDGSRPAHTSLLAAGVPIVEHMRGLDALPDTGFSFFATPPKISGMATFPVRAFAITGG